jgi:hypothetical protein
VESPILNAAGAMMAVETLVEYVFHMIIEKAIQAIVKMLKIPEKVSAALISIAVLTIEYYLRHARGSLASKGKAINLATGLKNHCGECGLKGHNRQNCPRLDEWLAFAETKTSDFGEILQNKIASEMTDQAIIGFAVL